jgi:hypothetical protein
LSLASAVASGAEFFGKKVDQGIALYLATEAPETIKTRMQALKREYGQDMKNFVMTPNPLNLYSSAQDAQDVVQLCQEIEKIKGQKVKIIIADTLARMSAGANENSGEDMGPVMERFSFICNQTGAAVLVIHHSGKDQARGMRGWSGILAHIDTEIEVIEDEGRKTATITKQRSLGSKGTEIDFELKVIEMGISKFGEPSTTCVAIPSQGQKNSLDKTTERDANIFIDAFWNSGSERLDGAPYVTRSALSRYLEVGQGWDEAKIKQALKTSDQSRFLGKLIKKEVLQVKADGYILIHGALVSKVNLLDKK